MEEFLKNAVEESSKMLCLHQRREEKIRLFEQMVGIHFASPAHFLTMQIVWFWSNSTPSIIEKIYNTQSYCLHQS